MLSSHRVALGTPHTTPWGQVTWMQEDLSFTVQPTLGGPAGPDAGARDGVTLKPQTRCVESPSNPSHNSEPAVFPMLESGLEKAMKSN